MTHAPSRTEEVSLHLFEHFEKKAEFCAEMRGGMGFPAMFEAERGFYFLLDAQEVVNVGGNCFPVERVIKLGAVLLNHILKPSVIMFL